MIAHYHRLTRAVDLAISQDDLWDFIATPRNLNDITPPELDFEILSDPPDRMFDGLLVDYRVKIPGFGRSRWVTEIKHIVEGHSFVDEQRVGPYRTWYHLHRIEPISETATRMYDTVHYEMPFWPLGEVVHMVRVKRLLARIFDFRTELMQERFGRP